MPEVQINTSTAPSISMAPAGNLPATLSLQNDGQPTFLPSMPSNELDAARKIAAAFDIENPVGASTFATQPLRDFQQAIHQLLDRVKTGDAGPAGDLAIAVSGALDQMKLPNVKAEIAGTSFASKLAALPGVGQYFSSLYYFAKRKQHFTKITDAIERQARGNIRTIIETMLSDDRHIAVVERNYNALRIYIAAGEIVLDGAQALFNNLRAQTETANDPLKINRLHALHERIVAFDNRLFRLKAAYVEAPLTGQQIRIGQTAKRTQLESIQNQLDFTLPKIEGAILQVAGLWQLKTAQADYQKVEDLDRKVAAMRNELLADTAKAAKATQGDSLARVQELQQYMTEVANLTRECLELDRQNTATRREAEAYLVQAAQQYQQIMQTMPTA